MGSSFHNGYHRHRSPALCFVDREYAEFSSGSRTQVQHILISSSSAVDEFSYSASSPMCFEFSKS